MKIKGDGKVSKVSQKADQDDEGIELATANGQTFLKHFNGAIAYLGKIDSANAQGGKIIAFELSSLVGAVTGELVCTVKGTKKIVNSFAFIRKQFKAEIYRGASLQPRASDADFTPNTSLEEQMDGNANDGLAVVMLQAAMGEVQAAACACGEFFNNHKFASVPMMAQSDAASTLNATNGEALAVVNAAIAAEQKQQQVEALLAGTATAGSAKKKAKKTGGDPAHPTHMIEYKDLTFNTGRMKYPISYKCPMLVDNTDCSGAVGKKCHRLFTEWDFQVFSKPPKVDKSTVSFVLM